MIGSSAPLRIGYVGCGFLAQKVHLPNLLAIDETELLAIAEARPKLGRRVQERLHIPRLYQSHHELGEDPDIEAVAVSGHFCGQGEIAADLLRAGKDVFLEKPMAISIAQAGHILAAERESGRRLMIGYMKRYDEGNVFVKAMLESPETAATLGKIAYVRLHDFSGNWLGGLDTVFDTTDEVLPAPPDCTFPSWLAESLRQQYLNYLQEYTHLVNLIRWFLDAGDDVQVITVDLSDDGYSGVAILRVAGVRTLLESGAHRYSIWDEHTQIYFERGWIRTIVPPLLSQNVPVSVEVYRSGDVCGTTENVTPTNAAWSYRSELRHFAQCLRDGKPFRSPAADALSDVRVLEDIYRRHVATQDLSGVAERGP